jgi:hypothetical protein
MDGGANRRSRGKSQVLPPPSSLPLSSLLPSASASPLPPPSCCRPLRQPRAPPKGSSGKRRAEPGGATKSWLRLPFGSREVLHGQLHTRSRCKICRLGGLRLKPLVEPEPEPSQTGPKSSPSLPSQHTSARSCPLLSSSKKAASITTTPLSLIPLRKHQTLFPSSYLPIFPIRDAMPRKLLPPSYLFSP